jgi:hypothetical protein
MGIEMSDHNLMRGEYRVRTVHTAKGETFTFSDALNKLRVGEVRLPARGTIYRIVSGEDTKENIAAAVKTNEVPINISPTAADDAVKANQTAETAKLIFSLLVDARDIEVIIGDLFEKYEKEIKRRGRRRAELWLYYEVARSVWPLVRRLVVRISGRIARTRRAE